MLSILIPCYNFNVLDLVKDIYNQAKLLKIEFEIICIEDGSTKTFSNSKLKKIDNVIYIENKINIGRSRIRNRLSKKAKFNWLLFIDCDSKITNKYFLSDYLKKTKYPNHIFYGKTDYQKKITDKNKKLHWLYGKHIESKRKKTQFSSHHFLIKKKVFNQVLFDEKIKGYGHEDTIFSIQIKSKNYTFIYTKNSLLHVGLEDNIKFIAKTENSIKNLIILKKRYDLNHLKIIKTHKILSYFFLDYIVKILFQFLKKHILKNLLSSKPNIFYFQFYKLGYYCEIIKRF